MLPAQILRLCRLLRGSLVAFDPLLFDVILCIVEVNLCCSRYSKWQPLVQMLSLLGVSFALSNEILHRATSSVWYFGKQWKERWVHVRATVKE